MSRLVLSLAVVAALAPPAAAQPKPAKPKPACGINWLPLVQGRQWTYLSITSPDPISDEQAATLEKAQKSAPREVEQVLIEVIKVDESPTGAQVTLKETAGALVQETTLRCTKDKVEISPQSFLFAGEPGGGLRMTLDKVEWSGVGFPGIAAFPKKFKHQLMLKADVKRESTPGSNAVMAPAKLELELSLENTGTEVMLVGDKPVKSDRIQFEIAGRAAVAPALDKTFEIPLGVPGRYWFAAGYGLVQVQNRLGHWYQLKEIK